MEFQIDFSPRTSLLESSRRSWRPDPPCTGSILPTEVWRTCKKKKKVRKKFSFVSVGYKRKETGLFPLGAHTHTHTNTQGHKTCPNEPTINTDLITIGSCEGRQVHKFYLLTALSWLPIHHLRVAVTDRSTPPLLQRMKMRLTNVDRANFSVFAKPQAYKRPIRV